jgi:hypothetical protein
MIRILSPETTVVEHDLAPLNVIAEAPAATPQPILATFTGLDPRQLEEVVSPCPVIGIGAENLQCFRINMGQIWVATIQAAQQAIKLGDRAHRKPWRHTFF